MSSIHFERRRGRQSFALISKLIGYLFWTKLAGNHLEIRNSLAHKSNCVGHVIVTTRLRRMHFPRPGFFLRWNSNLQQVDFSQGFASNNILGLVVLAVNDGFLHLHAFVISPFFCLHFLPFENSNIIIILF